MQLKLSYSVGASVLSTFALTTAAYGYTIDIDTTLPKKDVGEPLDGFVSFSIEFSSFPDYAGK